jgi:hypothetical protein
MANHKITITRAAGVLTVSSDPEIVKPNETLSFLCADDYAVFFKNARSPHSNGKRLISGQGGVESTKLKIRKLSIGEKAHPGDAVLGDRFSYGVAVLQPAAGPILTLDPDIIIVDGSGGGPARKKSAPKKR